MLADLYSIGYFVYWAALIATVAIAVSQRRNPKAAPLDDALQSTATRGSYVPLVIGRARVGPIFAWVDDATGTDLGAAPGGPEQPGFGKGGGGGGVSQYKEDGLHLLAIGPGSELRAIYQNGAVIWRGPITPDTHPSGSRITISDAEGSFEVYWGFPDDPVLPLLEDSRRHGLSVRYSHVFKILWNYKGLGPSRQWSRLEYDIACPCYSKISSTPSELPLEGDDAFPRWEDTEAPTPPGYADGDPVRFFITKCYFYNGNPAISVVVPGYVTSGMDTWADALKAMFPIGGILKLFITNDTVAGTAAWYTGGGGSGPFYVPGAVPNTPAAIGLAQGSWLPKFIRSVEVQQYAPGAIWAAAGAPLIYYSREIIITLDWGYAYRNVILNEVVTTPPATTGLLDIGWAEPIETEYSQGINPIHMIDQVLFASWPYGANKDRSKFDPVSIEAAALVLHEEAIRGYCLIQNGESVESVLANIMQDCGFFISWDVESGKFVFLVLRYDDPNNVTDLPAEVILKSPETTNSRGPRPIDTLAFTFLNRERNYREDPLVIADDGQVELNGSQRARKIEITVTADPRSATKMIPRRQSEALANVSTMTFETNHATMMAVPGKRISATSTEGEGLLFRITSVQRNISSSKVTLETIVDVYDPPPTTQTDDWSGVDSPPAPARSLARSPSAPQIIDFAALEVPRSLSNGSIQVFFPAARGSVRARAAAVWASGDAGSSFSLIGSTAVLAAGTLGDALLADSPAYDTDAVIDITPVGIDFDGIEDLSAHEVSWRAGRQLLLVGDEVIYLRGVGVDTLEGLIRGRHATVQAEHPEGTPFVVVLAHLATPLESSVFVPGRTVPYKLQSIESGRVSDPAIASVREIEIVGKAFSPQTPCALRQASFRQDYSSAADLTLVWSWHSQEFPRTGFGSQAAGQAAGVSPPRGHFVATFKDDSAVEMLEIVVDGPTLTLSPGARTSDTGTPFDGLPFWTVEIRQVEGSFTSPAATLTLTPA